MLTYGNNRPNVATKAMNLDLVFNTGVSDLEFTCNSTSFENCDSSDPGAPAPPLDITIDYGDNSGVARWNEDAPADIFQHVYSAPGTYHITIQSRSEGFLPITSKILCMRA